MTENNSPQIDATRPGEAQLNPPPEPLVEIATGARSRDSERVGASEVAEARLGDARTALEYAWRVHEYINEYIRFSDSKGGAVIAFGSGLIAVLYAAGLHKEALLKVPLQWGWSGILAAVSFCCLGAGIALAGFSIKPRLTNEQSRGFVFWESILGYGTPADLWRDLRTRNEEHLGEHLVHHLHTLAGVCRRKYRWVGLSMWFTFIGALAGIVGLMLKDLAP
jgi:hypothetical protein